MYSNDLINAGTSIEVTKDGGYIIAGTQGQDCLDFMQVESKETFSYILKTDVMGNFQWSGVYGYSGSVYSDETANDVQNTMDGGYVVTGYRLKSGSWSDHDAYLMKLNSAGTLQWSFNYGNTMPEDGNAVIETNDNGFAIAGYFNNNGLNNYTYLIKLSSDGNMLWDKVYGSNGIARAILQTSDGGYIMTGTECNNNNCDIFLLKCSSDGTLLWNKWFGGPLTEEAYALKQTTGGDLIIAGSSKNFDSNGDAYLLKTDPSGNLLWSKTYGGSNSDIAYSLDITNDDGYILTGSTRSFGLSGYDIYVVKTDKDGNSNCNEQIPSIITGTVTGSSSPYNGAVVTANITKYDSTSDEGPGALEDSVCWTTGIQEEKIRTCNIYPNPFTSSLTFEIDSKINIGELRFDMLDVFGRKMRELKITDRKFQIERNGLPSGIYFYKISSENKIIGTGKLIAQ